MAKQFLVSLNLNKNELQNAVIQNLATAPENAKEGQIYFDTVKKAFFVYQNGAWVTFVGTGVYEAKVAELEGAIAGKVAQADYDVKVAALEAKDSVVQLLLGTGTSTDVVANNGRMRVAKIWGTYNNKEQNIGVVQFTGIYGDVASITFTDDGK